MPYKTKGKDIYKQTTSGRWVKVGRGKTKGSAEASVRARYANEPGASKRRNVSRRGA